MFCLHICMCTMCVCGAYESQKRISDLLELVTVGCVLGIEPGRVLCKSKCS